MMLLLLLLLPRRRRTSLTLTDLADADRPRRR